MKIKIEIYINIKSVDIKIDIDVENKKEGVKMKAGRSCPMDYVLKEEMFEKSIKGDYDTLYIIGGLYGNKFAAEEIENIVENGRKKGEKSIVVLNGDSHWFDKDEKTFYEIEDKIKKWIPMQGNVEMEMTRISDIGVGCGCAYPECVDDESVERSNKIHGELKKIALNDKVLREELSLRPKVQIFSISDKKICVTHGDEKLLGGWGCSIDSLSSEKRQEELKEWMDKKNISVMAVSHTCSPVFIGYGKDGEENGEISEAAVINNGAAGLPNFNNGRYGIISRVSRYKSKDAIYRTKIGDIYVEGIPVNYNVDKFVEWFDKIWEKGSAAEISYRGRIVDSVDVDIESAIKGNAVLVVNNTSNNN